LRVIGPRQALAIGVTARLSRPLDEVNPTRRRFKAPARGHPGTGWRDHRLSRRWYSHVAGRI